MFSVIGRLAKVDLNNETVTIEPIPDESFKKFLGGNGLAIKIMLDIVRPGIDPLSPENIIIFATGPVTGTGIQGSDRTCIASKSPLNGLFFDSYMGGRFASTLKLAGYDALIVTGKAKKHKFILINEDNISILDAQEIIGKCPRDVLANLTTKMGEIEVCTTGIAGENLVKYANIVHPRFNGRHGISGRGGMGAVMAAKNLKAVVVKRVASSKLTVHSDKLLKDTRAAIQTNLNTKTKRLRELGTPAGISMINNLGALGTRNLTDEIFEFVDGISGETLRNKYYRKNITCFSCPVACGKLCELDGKLVKAPEYETLYSLGSMVGLGDPETIVRANSLCDEYGLDSITMGISIALAIECFQRGLISKKESEGLELRFGDRDLVLSLIEATAHRQGIGNLLAEGTRRLSKLLGKESWKYAYQVKGLELPGHSARAHKVMSIGYATGTRGGSHQDTRPRYGPDMSSYEGKVEQAIASQNQSAVGDSLVQCRFVMEAGLGIGFNDIYTDLLHATTGWGPNSTELNKIGERICSMERIFNVKEGISRKDDTLPYRVMWEEVPHGPLKGARTPAEKLDEMLDNYYQLRGWDETGIPRREVLSGLGLQKYFDS